MKVRCIENMFLEKLLTKNKIYNVEKELEEHFTIESDNSTIINASKHMFEIVEEKEGDDMKTYKTWEVLKMIEENKTLEFKNKRGEIIKYKNYCVRILKDNKNLEFYGFDIEDEWILIKQPVTFEEVLSLNKRCKVEHELINDEINICCNEKVIKDSCKFLISGRYLELNYLMLALSWIFSNEGIRKIIEEGKWYLED